MSASQRLIAAPAIASNVGWTDAGELEITRRISPAAFSRSRLSARRFSSSRSLEPPSLGDLLATEGLALPSDFLGVGPCRISFPWSLTLIGRRQARRMGPCGQGHLRGCRLQSPDDGSATRAGHPHTFFVHRSVQLPAVL